MINARKKRKKIRVQRLSLAYSLSLSLMVGGGEIHCQNIKLTLIDDWRLVTIVNESWQFTQVVLIGERFIVNLHETDAELISFVVDVFQLLQCFRAFATLRLV